MAVDANGNQIPGTPAASITPPSPIMMGTTAIQPVVTVPAVPQANAGTVLPFNPGQGYTVVQPKPVYNLSADDVNNFGGDFMQITGTNTTNGTVNMVFSALNGLAGSYSEFNQNPSACDTPGFIDDFGANAQKLQGFNKLIAVQPLIASNITVTAASNTQANQRFSISQVDCNLEFSTKSRMTSICDPCTNNNNSNVFNRSINGPLYFGGNTSISYPVLQGQTVTLQIVFSGKGNAPAIAQAGA